MSKKVTRTDDPNQAPVQSSQSGADNPSPGSSEQKTPAKPNKTTPVFIYLAILFAAAFLMLLLAYFVQLRNSENTIDDLRTSMTATREELMEQNRQLQDENKTLQTEKEQLQEDQLALQSQVGELQNQLKEAEDSGQTWSDLYQESERNSTIVYDLWRAEELFEAEEYEQSAQILRELFAPGSENNLAHFTEGELNLQEKALHMVEELTKRDYLEEEDIDLELLLVYDGGDSEASSDGE